jgi:nitrogen fixation NifU-like protein
MNSETCIDNLDIQVKLDGDKIEDVRYDGEACAICTSSTSIMSELVVGKTKEEAKVIYDNYMNMIYEKDYDPEILEEAIAFKNTHNQANRIKCATLGWSGLKKILEGSEE